MSEYDNYLTRQNEERAARVAGFRSQLNEVAKQLGAQFVQRNDEGVFAEQGDLVFSDGLVIYASQYKDGYKNGAPYRIRFSMLVPREQDGSYRSLRDYGLVARDSSEPEISVAYDAEPARMAKDISRRLIEKNALRDKFAKVLEIQASRRDFQNAKQALTAGLFAMAGEKLRDRDLEPRNDPTLRLYEFAPGVSYGDMRVNSHDSVRIELSVNAELAKEILALLAARRASRQAEVANG